MMGVTQKKKVYKFSNNPISTSRKGTRSHSREHSIISRFGFVKSGRIGVQRMAPRHFRGHAVEEADRTQSPHRFAVAWPSRTP